MYESFSISDTPVFACMSKIKFNKDKGSKIVIFLFPKSRIMLIGIIFRKI